MLDFFSGIDLTSLGDKAKDFVNLAKAGTENAVENIKAESKPIAESAKKTIQIGNDTLKLLASGKIDKEGAEQIFKRGIHQLEDLARAESNLIISKSVSFLKIIGETAISFFSPL